MTIGCLLCLETLIGFNEITNIVAESISHSILVLTVKKMIAKTLRTKTFETFVVLLLDYLYYVEKEKLWASLLISSKNCGKTTE